MILLYILLFLYHAFPLYSMTNGIMNLQHTECFMHIIDYVCPLNIITHIKDPEQNIYFCDFLEKRTLSIRNLLLVNKVFYAIIFKKLKYIESSLYINSNFNIIHWLQKTNIDDSLKIATMVHAFQYKKANQKMITICNFLMTREDLLFFCYEEIITFFKKYKKFLDPKLTSYTFRNHMTPTQDKKFVMQPYYIKINCILPLIIKCLLPLPAEIVEFYLNQSSVKSLKKLIEKEKSTLAALKAYLYNNDIITSGVVQYNKIKIQWFLSLVYFTIKQESYCQQKKNEINEWKNILLLYEKKMAESFPDTFLSTINNDEVAIDYLEGKMSFARVLAITSNKKDKYVIK